MTWISVIRNPPIEGQLVKTCILDTNGTRNEQPLIRKSNLWFVSDMTMYVYYVPSHWKPIDNPS